MITLKEVYNKISKQFDQTRGYVWPSIKDYLNTLKINSKVLDIGCGNGKNMLYRPELQMIGIDFSEEMVKISSKKGLDVICSDMCNLPFPDNSFDHFICVASYHHLDNENDRRKALNQFYRILKSGGTGFIQVWAMEQPPEAKRRFSQEDEMVPWKDKNGYIYYRYYHIYRKGQLEEEIISFEPKFDIIESGYQRGNWYVIIKKD